MFGIFDRCVLDRFAGIICACVETLHDVCRSDSDSSIQIEYDRVLFLQCVCVFVQFHLCHYWVDVTVFSCVRCVWHSCHLFHFWWNIFRSLFDFLIVSEVFRFSFTRLLLVEVVTYSLLCMNVNEAWSVIMSYFIGQVWLVTCHGCIHPCCLPFVSENEMHLIQMQEKFWYDSLVTSSL